MLSRFISSKTIATWAVMLGRVFLLLKLPLWSCRIILLVRSGLCLIGLFLLQGGSFRNGSISQLLSLRHCLRSRRLQSAAVSLVLCGLCVGSSNAQQQTSWQNVYFAFEQAIERECDSGGGCGAKGLLDIKPGVKTVPGVFGNPDTFIPYADVTVGFTWVQWAQVQWTKGAKCPSGGDSWHCELDGGHTGACTGVIPNLTVTKRVSLGGGHVSYETYAEAKQVADDYSATAFCKSLGGSTSVQAFLGNEDFQNYLNRVMLATAGTTDTGQAIKVPFGLTCSVALDEDKTGLPSCSQDCNAGFPFKLFELTVTDCCMPVPCPDPGTCPKGFHWDDSVCECKPNCPPQPCDDGKTWDPLTCDCITSPPVIVNPDPNKPAPPPPPGGPGPNPDPNPNPDDPNHPDAPKPELPDPNNPKPGEPGPGPGPGPNPSPDPVWPVDPWPVDPEPAPDPDPTPSEPVPGEEGVGGGRVGNCSNSSAVQACGKEWGVYKEGDNIRFTVYVRDTVSVHGDKAGDGSIKQGQIVSQWRKIKITIPWEEAKHWCCWQMTWGVGLPESSVDWDTVNGWQVRGDENHKNLAWVIRQTVDLDYWQSEQERSWGDGRREIDAPEGYGCAVFMFPGPGCDYDPMNSGSMDGMLKGLESDANEGFTSYTNQVVNQTASGLTAINYAIGEISDTLTSGLFGSADAALASWEEKLADARAAADAIDDDFWQIKIGVSLYDEHHEYPGLRDYRPGGQKSALTGEKSHAIRQMVTVAWYLLVFVIVARIFMPKTTPVDTGN